MAQPAQPRMRTHTDYDLAHLEELQRVVCRTLSPQVTRRVRIANGAWGLVFFAAALCLALGRHSFPAAGILGALALFFLGRSLFFYKFVAWGVRQGMDKAVTGSEYLLDKTALQVMNPKGSHRYPYGDCAYLLETQGNFYFILASGEGLILDKANLKGGTVEELRAWLEEKCGRKAQWLGDPKSLPQGGSL